MELERYSVAIIVSDPDDPDTSVKVELESCPRERLLNLEVNHIGNTVRLLEQMVEEASE